MARLSIIKRGTTNYTLGATELVSVNGTRVTSLDAGSNTQFVYFSEGKPVASNLTTSSGKLIYLYSGNIFESSDMIGAFNWPVYVYGGQIQECNEIDEGEGTW